MTRISHDPLARYRHTSGATAMATVRYEGDSIRQVETIELHALDDPRKFDGAPFTVKIRKELVTIRRDPEGGYTPENAMEVEIDGAYYAEPIKVSRAQFDAEWVEWKP